MNGDLFHGGAIDMMRRAFPCAPVPWLDLSTGINPWAYPDVSVSIEALHHLPTSSLVSKCKRAMATAIGAPQEALLLAPGSELLIRLLPTVISPKRIAVLSPSYGDHLRVWRSTNIQIIETPNPLERAHEVDAVVLCHPNNPDGLKAPIEQLEKARQSLSKRGGWVIVDEAYADLEPDESIAPMAGKEGLIVLRSFGKFFGLAGLRLGAILAPSPILQQMSERLGVWTVSGAALEVGARAYADLKWQQAMRAKLVKARRALDCVLVEAGLNIVGGTDLFRLIEVDDAHKLWKKLADQGIYVRRFEWSERFLRIGIPSSQLDLERLSAALIP